MAYYPKASGVNGHRFAKAQEDCMCIICYETIHKGAMRYVKGKLSLCIECKNVWYEEGGPLGGISRSKHEDAEYLREQHKLKIGNP